MLSFIFDRLAGSLREQGYSAQEVDAVLALRPQRLSEVTQRLAAVRAFAALPDRYDEGGAYVQYKRAREATVDILKALARMNEFLSKRKAA